VCLLLTAIAATVTSTAVLHAQSFDSLQTAGSPLVLKAQGSFYIGGERIEQTQVELGGMGADGHITIHQMYVRYMVPQRGEDNWPVVMIHGATLTGKTWETTPDGRMGWDEYFVRKGRAVYIPDQVGRGRSGFDQSVYNNVRGGSIPPAKQPVFLRFSDEAAWPNFRIGPKAGVAFEDSQSPVEAAPEFSKQAVPDISLGLPQPSPTIKALSDLSAKLNGAVLISHSQSGSFPLDAALLNPDVAKGLVLVEPGACPTRYTDDQIRTLARIPILILFGDHRDNATGLPMFPTWQGRFEVCQAFVARLKAAGGQPELLDPTTRGIRGNTHMMMQDKNSLQIADLILDWIDTRASKRSVRK